MKRIKTLYAYIVDNSGDEGEGIVAHFMGGAWMPLVFSDKDNIDLLRPMVKKLKEKTGNPIKLIKFTSREDLETI